MQHSSKPPGAGDYPLGWDLLKFNQIGLFDVRRRIGVFATEPGVYDRHRARFDAADLAWFAAGLSTDVLRLTQNMFPPEFNDLREGMPSGEASSRARAAIRTRIQKLTFDLAALWDRTFGGATLILHVEGATRPNSLKLPEYIKSDVYFPGYLIEANPRFSPIISELVQKFIVDIGMPVIERWEQCARSIWPLTQGAGRGVPPPYPSQPMQPDAIPRGSSTFVYNGRPSSDQPHHVGVEFDAVESMLSATKEALAKSLAREEELRVELSNLRGILSTRIDGNDFDVIVGRCQVGSANHHAPSTPRISHHNLPTPRTTPHISPTPASRHGNAFASPSHASQIARRLFSNPSPHSEGPSEFDIPAPTPPEIEALAAYYDFLNTHQLTHLRDTLDLIRRSIPISLWAEQLEKANVPLDLIDSIMVLMATPGVV